MSIVTILGGYLIDANGSRHQLPVVLKPSDSMIEDSIRKVFNTGKGVVVLSCESSPEIGPEKLELYVDNSNLLLMLGVNEEDGDYGVRTLFNENMSDELMMFMGEGYPAKAVTRDIETVFSAFKEFVRHGNVLFMK